MPHHTFVKWTWLITIFRRNFRVFFYDLSSLHLEGNELISLDDLPKLKSLTLINQKVSIRHFPIAFPALKTLTIDYCWKGLKYSYVNKLPCLERLRVLRSVDWKTMSQIRALQLKSVRVQHCFQVPTEENVILKLNDDCLYHLQTFLSANDCISLFRAHSRFQQLRIPEFELYWGSIPRDSNILQRIGPLVNRLKLSLTGHMDLHCSAQLSFFTGLKVPENDAWPCPHSNSGQPQGTHTGRRVIHGRSWDTGIILTTQSYFETFGLFQLGILLRHNWWRPGGVATPWVAKLYF